MVKNHHDKGFKRILSKKRHFLDLIRNFIPYKWTDNIDEKSLQLVDKEFIPSDFVGREADIIYKCNVDGRVVVFFVLLELQSTVDYTMPFRLMTYMYELMKREFINTPEDERRRRDFRLTSVAPIVLYNGKQSWNVVKSFGEYHHCGRLLKENTVDFQYILIDTKKYDDDTLLDIGKLVSIIFALDNKQEFSQLNYCL